MSKGNGIRISVGNGRLTITVPTQTLIIAFENDPVNESFDGLVFSKPQITNALNFLGDVVHELDREAEDGTTLLNAAFDSAMRAAWENGSEHIAMVTQQPFKKSL